MSIIRKRSAAHKSYIPNNARDNQYILAEFAITDKLLAKFSEASDTQTERNYYHFYQKSIRVWNFT